MHHRPAIVPLQHGATLRCPPSRSPQVRDDVFEPEGNALKGNTFVNHGYYANPSNSDFGQIVLHTGLPLNCFTDDTALGGSAPANLEQLQPVCGVTTTTTTNGDSTLLGQVECDARLLPALPTRSIHRRLVCARHHSPGDSPPCQTRVREYRPMRGVRRSSRAVRHSGR